jgi:outer membrane protein TolC
MGSFLTRTAAAIYRASLGIVLVGLSVTHVHAEETPSLDFDQAVQSAVTRNPSAELANDEIRRAEALVQEVRAAWLPTLAGNLAYTRLDANRAVGSIILAPIGALNGNLLATVPLVSPKQWVASARSKDGVGIAQRTAEDAKKQAGVAAAHAYLTVVAQHRVLETAQRALKTARAHEDYARTRLGGGLGNRLDAVRATQERASDEAAVEVQQLALTRAQEALGVLIGRNGPADARGEATLAAAPQLTAAMDEAASRRTDVLLGREQVEVARKTARDLYANYLPTLSAVGQPFVQTPGTALVPSTGWQAQVVLSLPLFDGGYRYGLAKEAHVLEDEAKTRLEGVLRQARSDVRVGFESVRRADSALVQSREASRLAQEALDLAQLAYRTGTTSNIELIDAERHARDADTATAIAEDAARQARIDLLAACGRFP